jgi:hypothetical protein
MELTDEKKTAFDPLHMEEERTLTGHTGDVKRLAVHGDKLISGSNDTIKVWNANA